MKRAEEGKDWRVKLIEYLLSSEKELPDLIKQQFRYIVLQRQDKWGRFLFNEEEDIRCFYNQLKALYYS